MPSRILLLPEKEIRKKKEPIRKTGVKDKLFSNYKWYTVIPWEGFSCCPSYVSCTVKLSNVY